MKFDTIFQRRAKMTSRIPTIAEKCQGAMIATAIGDALGWPNERPYKTKEGRRTASTHFIEWMRKGSRPHYHSEKILAGEYSDDTQLTLSVARSIIAGNWEIFFMERELPFWLNYERGGGRAVLTAARFYKTSDNYKLWESNKRKDYFNAGGNGAVMRILPHVIANAANNDVSQIMMDVFKNTMITHGHPRAFLGSTCYAYALNFLLRKATDLKRGELIQAIIDGKHDWGMLSNFHVFDDWIASMPSYGEHDFRAEWEKTYTRMSEHLAMIQKELPKGALLNDREILSRLDCFGKTKGAGDVTILAALYLTSKYASNPILGIKIPAFSYGADTDTIASITGGLLGMLNGIDWFPPEWLEVQDYTCLLHIADLLLAENRKDLVKEKTLALEEKETGWQNTLIGKMKTIHIEDYSTQSTQKFMISKWKTTLGQTLYTRDFNRHSSVRETSGKDHPPSLSPPVITHESQAKSLSEPTEKFFFLSKENIAELLNDPLFNKKTTCGKLLEAVRLILENDLSSSDIAKKIHMKHDIIERLKYYIK